MPSQIKKVINLDEEIDKELLKAMKKSKEQEEAFETEERVETILEGVSN